MYLKKYPFTYYLSFIIFHLNSFEKNYISKLIILVMILISSKIERNHFTVKTLSFVSNGVCDNSPL